MGMYTEIFVNVDLVKGVPELVLDVLRAGELDLDSRFLFGNASYYTPGTRCHSLTWDEISQRYSFIGKGDLKNYENEIERFFTWLQPYIDAEEGEFIGYSRHEGSRSPVLYFKKGE